MRGGCPDGRVRADFKKVTILICFCDELLILVQTIPPLFITQSGRQAEVRTCIYRAQSRPFTLTVLLEDMELRVLRLLASVTTMAEGKRDGWEY